MNVGILGKKVLNQKEKVLLFTLGRYIAKLGHNLLVIPTKGTASQIREGFESEGSEAQTLESGVIESSDWTLVYPDKRLLSRLNKLYPNIDSHPKVRILAPEPLDQWVAAAKEAVKDKGMTPP